MWFSGSEVDVWALFGHRKMDLVRELLRRSDLQKYGDAFEKNGYDSVKQLAQMKPSDFDKLGELTHMLPGHVHRLQAHIRDTMRMQIKGQPAVVYRRNCK